MELYRRVADVNLFGVVHVTKTFLPMIRKSKGKSFFPSCLPPSYFFIVIHDFYQRPTDISNFSMMIYNQDLYYWITMTLNQLHSRSCYKQYKCQRSNFFAKNFRLRDNKVRHWKFLRLPSVGDEEIRSEGGDCRTRWIWRRDGDITWRQRTSLHLPHLNMIFIVI